MLYLSAESQTGKCKDQRFNLPRPRQFRNRPATQIAPVKIDEKRTIDLDGFIQPGGPGKEVPLERARTNRRKKTVRSQAL